MGWQGHTSGRWCCDVDVRLIAENALRMMPTWQRSSMQVFPPSSKTAAKKKDFSAAEKSKRKKRFCVYTRKKTPLLAPLQYSRNNIYFKWIKENYIAPRRFYAPEKKRGEKWKKAKTLRCLFGSFTAFLHSHSIPYWYFSTHRLRNIPASRLSVSWLM